MKILFDYIKIMLKYSPYQAILITVMNILNGTCPVITVGFSTEFVNLALEVINKRAVDKRIYFYITALLLLIGYELMLPTLQRFVFERAKLNIQSRYRGLLLEKCAKIQYQYIENPDSWDLISRVLEKPEYIIVNIFNSLTQLLATIISVVGIMLIIIAQIWWAVIIILVCCVPLFYFSIKSGKANYKAKCDSAELDRRACYYSEVLSGRENIDERSMFGYSEKINEEYHKAYKESFRIQIDTKLRWFMRTKIGGVFTAISSLVVILVLLEPTVTGRISIGMFISLVNAILSLSGKLSWELSLIIDTIVDGLEHIKEIRRFMNFKEKIGALDKPIIQKEVKNIEFKNVSFAYPGTEVQILRNVSFTLENGKHYAFVGANGTGKTTIIKLLTGLYTNYGGEIMINGKELKEYQIDELKGFFSIVYQDFAKHEFTFRENILIGNLELATTEDDQQIKDAINLIEMRSTVESLPKGLNTNLGTIHEDGVDLSGGQWQRLAMTRAIISDAPVRILDEPTASLDPLSENRIYELFGRISHSALTIFISHRLASTKIADEILVFNNGIIEEKGSFDSLMAKRGLYCEMFEQQRSWYR